MRAERSHRRRYCRWRGARASAAILASAPFLAVACDGETPVPENGSEGPDTARQIGFTVAPPLAGDLFLGDGILRFVPCGTETPQPVDDPTGAGRRAVEELGYGTERVRAAVVLEGSRLAEVRHAAPEAVGCEGLLADAVAEARGNEPFWTVTVFRDSAVWRDPETPDGTLHEEGDWAPRGSGEWRFTAAGIPSRAPGLQLDLREERCVDSMSGAWFPLSARVRRGELEAEGCALEGMRAGTSR